MYNKYVFNSYTLNIGDITMYVYSAIKHNSWNIQIVKFQKPYFFWNYCIGLFKIKFLYNCKLFIKVKYIAIAVTVIPLNSSHCGIRKQKCFKTG